MFFLCAFADKVCDAVEVAGRNVMSTTSVVTTGLVSDRYLSQLKYVFNASLHISVTIMANITISMIL